MGRPRADLAAYSPWGAVPVPPPVPPDPAWLPVVPWAGVQTWSDLAIYALQIPAIAGQISLFTNFYQPTEATTLADLTPPTAAGLAAQLLPPAIRGGVNANGRAVWTWPPITFTAAGAGLPVQIWGYFVSCTDPYTGLPALLWAQRLVSSFGFLAPGNQLTIALNISFAQC